MKYAASTAILLALCLSACGPKEAADTSDAETPEAAPVTTETATTSDTSLEATPSVSTTPPVTEDPECTGPNCNTGGNGRPIEDISIALETEPVETPVATVSGTVTAPSFDASGAPPSCEGEGCEEGGNGRPIEDILGAAAQVAGDAVAEAAGIEVTSDLAETVDPTCEGEGCEQGGNGRPIEDILGNAAETVGDAVADVLPEGAPEVAPCEGEGCEEGGNGRPIEPADDEPQ